MDISSQGFTNDDTLNEKYSLEIDMEWKNKKYGEVLSRLRRDELFLETFKLEDLNEEDEDQKNLKLFAEERNLLHQWIEEGNFKKIEEHVSKTESKYYFSSNDQSAAFTAIKNKKFEIYAYLKSINVELAEEEKDSVKELSELEQIELAEEIRVYFPTNEKSHIYDLISKSKPNSQNFETYEEKITKYFEKLNEIPEISIILKVNQFVNDLEINFDFNHDDIEKMFPSSPPCARGLNFNIGTYTAIYIAAGMKSENEILGAMAHEFTHMAMDFVFENNGSPYLKWDKDKKKEFEDIVNKCKDIKNLNDGPSLIVSNIFQCYPEEMYEIELIVTVPHILMQFNYIGKKWLLNEAPDLFNFYLKNVIPECEKLIKEKFLLKPKRFIRNLNETEGEIKNIGKFGLRFRNIDKLVNFINSNKNIFAIITKNTWIGLLRIYQTIGDDLNKSPDRFLILKFENFLDRFEDVECAFRSKILEILIIECSNILNGTKKILKIFDLAKEKNKKIVFVIKEKDYKNLYELVNGGLENLFEKIKDEDLNLMRLDETSRKKILNKQIIFQDKKMPLSDLINNDKDLLKNINEEMIGKLLMNEKLKFSKKPFGTSNLNGAYADIYYEINLEMLIEEIKNGEDIFLVDGITGPDKEIEFFNFLGKNFDISIVKKLNNYNCKISGDTKIFLTDSETSEKNFQRFCHNNSSKKIYLIEKKFTDKVIFMLKEIYNPNFYFEREFKISKVISKDFLERNFYVKSDDDQVIISVSNNESSTFADPNIKCLNFEDAENAFKNLSNSGKIVHMLKIEGEKLIWIKSHGLISNLREFLIKDSDKKYLSEGELIREITNQDVAIFADVPGMGKSTTLTKLYESKSVTDTHWVIRINLRNHVEIIKSMIRKDINLHIVKNFLKEIDTSLNNKFSSDLLNSALDKNKNFPKQLLLAFDGFDELLDQPDRNKVINLLKFLKENTKCKIWITTRKHFQFILEDELSTFAIRLIPISDSSKISFIKNYIKDRLKVVLSREKYKEIFEKNSKILNYSEIFLEIMKIIFKENVKKFIGTPLQLHLLLEGSLESFLNYIKNSEGNPDFSYLGRDIYQVFKRFFNRKYDIYFRKKGIIEETQQTREKIDYEDCHELIAAKQYIAFGYRISSKLIDPLLLVGIINENLEFLHFTFREYFFARYFVKFLNEERVCIRIKSFEYLLCNVLFEDKYKVVRTFINFMLKNRKKKPLLNISFGNEFKKNIIGHAQVHFHIGSIFHVLIIEKKNYLFRFLFMENFSLPEYEMLLRLENIQGDTLLLLAILTQNEFVLDLIIKIMIALSPEVQYGILKKLDLSNLTVLDLAIERNNMKIIEKIFTMAEKIFSNDDMVEFLCENSKTPNSTSALEKAAIFGYFDIFKHLFQKILRIELKERVFDLFSPNSHYGYGYKVLLLLANPKITYRPQNKENHIEIFKYIFNEAKLKLSAEGFNKLFYDLWSHQFQYGVVFDLNIIQYLFQVAVDIFPKDETNDEIFDEKLMNRFYQLITMKDQTGQNLLQIAIMCERFEIIDFILNKLPPEKRHDLVSMTDHLQFNSFHNSCMVGNAEIVKLLIPDTEEEWLWNKHYELIKMKENNGNTPFHLAALYGHFEVVEKLLKKLKQYLSEEELKIYINDRNLFEYNALDLANQKKHIKISSIISKELKS